MISRINGYLFQTFQEILKCFAFLCADLGRIADEDLL